MKLVCYVCGVQGTPENGFKAYDTRGVLRWICWPCYAVRARGPKPQQELGGPFRRLARAFGVG